MCWSIVGVTLNVFWTRVNVVSFPSNIRLEKVWLASSQQISFFLVSERKSSNWEVRYFPKSQTQRIVGNENFRPFFLWTNWEGVLFIPAHYWRYTVDHPVESATYGHSPDSCLSALLGLDADPSLHWSSSTPRPGGLFARFPGRFLDMISCRYRCSRTALDSEMLKSTCCRRHNHRPRWRSSIAVWSD